MTSDQFCYWLQGLFELSQIEELNETQVKIIKDHLQLVFKKETPDRHPLKFEDIIDPNDFKITPIPYTIGPTITC